MSGNGSEYEHGSGEEPPRGEVPEEQAAENAGKRGWARAIKDKIAELRAGAERIYTPKEEIRQPKDELLIVGYPTSMHRDLRLPIRVHDRKWPITMSTAMPHPRDNLPEPLADFQRTVASRLIAGVQEVLVYQSGMSIEVRKGLPDRLGRRVYEAVALCLFESDEDLQSLRLDFSNPNARRAREAADLDQTMYSRSDFVPPPDPAPATPPDYPPPLDR